MPVRAPALLPAAAVLSLLLAAACTPKPGTDGAEGKPAVSGKDACGAADFQTYVGKRIDALNDVTLPEGARVLFPTTPATMDLREDRLNVEVGKDDHIVRIFCG